MGVLFSRRVGSDPYYADYDRALARLRSETDRLQKRRSDRKQTLEAMGTAIFRYGSVGFVLSVVLAAWVQQQPDGTFSTREHSMLVLPLFLEPALAYLLYEACHHALEWRDAKDVFRLKMLDGKLRKMVTELKDSTRYAKTHKLLEKYDPDYCPPTPRPPPPIPGTGARASPPSGRGQPAAGGSTVRRGAATGMFLPALDKLAASVIGDNPSLMDALRAAETEAVALKARLANAEQWARYLARENAQLKAQLGLAPHLMLEGPAGNSEVSGASTPSVEAVRQLFTEATPSNIEEPNSPQSSPSPATRRSADVEGRGGPSHTLVRYRSLTDGAEPSRVSMREPLDDPLLAGPSSDSESSRPQDQSRLPDSSLAGSSQEAGPSALPGGDQGSSDEPGGSRDSGEGPGGSGKGVQGLGEGLAPIAAGKGGDVNSHAIHVDSSAPSTPHHGGVGLPESSGLHRRPSAVAVLDR